MAVQKFNVSGATAENERAIEAALAGLAGVLYASVSHREGCAEVDFDDDAVTTEAMVRAAANIGVEMHIAG